MVNAHKISLYGGWCGGGFRLREKENSGLKGLNRGSNEEGGGPWWIKGKFLFEFLLIKLI